MKLYRPVGQKTLWPLNSIYLSISPTNPSTYFGGTWVQLKNAFLFATNATSGNKGTGSGTGTSTGAATGNTGSTTLTAAQSGMPSHTHYIVSTSGSNIGVALYPFSMVTQNYATADGNVCRPADAKNATEGHTHTLNSHKHTIPYIEVYVFKRTA